MRPRVITLLAPLAAGVALVVGGTFVYLNVLTEAAPARLDVSEEDADGSPAAGGGLAGTWKPGPGSVVGYRAKEVLFGQSKEAVGRTEDVTGAVTATDEAVTAASFVADLTTVASDEDRRDNQFRGRIMDVATHPTATFELVAPVDLTGVAGATAAVTREARGELTLRGTTKAVTVGLTVRPSAGGFEVAGSVPIVFAEWGIPEPSFGPAQVEDRGVLEFLLVLVRG